MFMWSFFDGVYKKVQKSPSAVLRLWLQPRRQATKRSSTLLNLWWELEDTEFFTA